jgi:regulator of replication initiation timing
MDTNTVLTFVAELQARLSKLSFENERLVEKIQTLVEEKERLLVKIKVKEEIIDNYDAQILADRGYVATDEVEVEDEDGDANMH